MVDLNEEEFTQFEDFLEHIGIRRRSGRYPWGSGKDEYQRSLGFKKYYDEMKKIHGLTDGEIVKALQDFAGPDTKVKITSADLRAASAVSTEIIRDANRARAMSLTTGRNAVSQREAARIMGVNESNVRGWLKDYNEIREGSLRATADILKQELITKPFLDVGKGTHLYLGIAETKLKQTLAMLKDEGYEIYNNIKAPQLSGAAENKTTFKVLCKEGTPWADARQAVLNGEVKIVAAQSDDNGQTFSVPSKLEPTSVSSKRVSVRYAEDGGTTKDGVIELRRGVPDLDLGASRYAQVRVAVDGTHYLKGMAMYADDLPPGVDIRFNTNKTKAEAPTKLDAMKPLKGIEKTGKIDASNPFGATVLPPRVYKDKNGKEKTSPLNIVNEEGKWDDWSRSLSSQMLSKQAVPLAARQLGIARKAKEKDLDEIIALTNPVVKKKLLEEYADAADSASVHLKAAAIPRQITSVILPINSMRPTEAYAPQLNTGDKVVLVRHPHGGPFEIPALTVNNNNREAKRLLGNAKDAIGIHHSVANKLSGADFDGDTVLVIPNEKGEIKYRSSLDGLKDFDPKAQYKIPASDTTTKRMSKKNTQTEMGKISNLITDMTIKGAPDRDLEAAVRHSMVVIDAEKHGLNYKASEKDNNIARLKETYQGGAKKGAATLISRASSDTRVLQQRPRRMKDDPGGPPIDPKTGEKVFVKTGATYQKKHERKDGTVYYTTEDKTTKGTRMEFAKDAFDLISDANTPMEEVYALHANSMKALANRARKEAVSIQNPKPSKQAKAVYADEVKSLNQKLEVALRNAPLERRAQVIGNAMANAKIDANPGYDKDDVKKIRYQAQEEARLMTGAGKQRIHITDREWTAIQSWAVAPSRLAEILRNADMDRVRDLATPKTRGTSLTPGQLAKARSMEASGKNPSDIAEALGIPRTTLVDNLKRT